MIASKARCYACGSSGVYNNSVGLPNSFVGFSREIGLIGSNQVDGRSSATICDKRFPRTEISSARLRRIATDPSEGAAQAEREAVGENLRCVQEFRKRRSDTRI